MRKFILLASFIISGFLFQAFSQRIAFDAPYLEGFHPLDAPSSGSTAFGTQNPAILKLNTTLFKDTSVVDFEKRQITFKRFDELGYTMWEYHYAELSDYLLARRNFALYRGWQSGISVGKKNDARDKQQVMKFQWELPVQYPSWAQRVLGNEPPSLKISGSLKINIGFDRSTLVQAYNDNTTGGLDFDPEYSISVTGSAGKLITINIRADKDNFQVSDIFKDFKIEYKESTPGELEDDILQEAQIGWTGFEMPGTALSGYSENHGGLFGIKTRFQLGPLSLTSIISHERGEAKKDTFYTEGTSRLEGYAEDTYQKYRFYFLNNRYRELYNMRHALIPAVNPPKPPEVKELQVWKRELSVSTNNDKLMERRNARVDDDNEVYPFVKLLPERHYILDEEEGYIMFMDSTIPGTYDHIAILLRTEDPAMDKGSYPTETDTVMHLWTLKPKDEMDSAAVDPERYHLMWRNVYDLSVSDWVGFKLKVVQKSPESTTENEFNFENKRYSDILGITVDGVLKTNDDIVKKSHGVLIIPPFDTTFYGNEPFRNKALGDFVDTMIYVYSDERRHQLSYQPQFLMYKASSGRRTSFDLCWGMMEGEIVTADGSRLAPNDDYVVDYDMGQLTLVSARAKSCNMIVVEYQCESMFVPESKTFIGVRGELKLPFISDKSFIGGSFLYQRVSTKDLIPQLNQEPFTKMLLDLNSRIDLEPEWMTALVNKLPGIKTEAASQVLFDFEVAHSIMNPNSKRKPQAYVDDFEDSNQGVDFPVGHRSWFQASPPFYFLDSTTTPDSLYYYPPAFNYYWYSPRLNDSTRVRITDVKDSATVKVGAGQSNDQPVLRLHCKPSPAPQYNSKFKNSWAGIMYPMPYSYKKRTESQYFEFYMAVPGGAKGKGKLLIQMGRIREDLSLNGRPPNKRGDYEDTTAGSDIYNPNAYGDGSQDLGLDRLPDSLEEYYIPSLYGNILQWDTISIKKNRWLLGADSLDPARDNYRSYDRETDPVSNRRYVCKLEKDNELTSEDINNDNNVDDALMESFFQFTIDLEKSEAPYIDKQANLAKNTIWKKYRIPLKEKVIIDSITKGTLRKDFNNPNWENITTVRLIWTGFDSTLLNTELELILSEMRFVGSQWLPVLDSVGTKVEATSINSEDDAFYRSNIDNRIITRERDERGDTVREYSLRINYRNIKPGESALVTKNYKYQNINLTAYDTLSLALFGRAPQSTPLHTLINNGNTDFLFRFGSDDSTYYEFRTDIYSGWQELFIDLKQIADIKDRYLITHPDQRIDVDTAINGGNLRIYAPRGRQPTFSNINWMGLGVYSDSANTQDIEGEIWVNEMKVRGIGWVRGTAMRASVTTKWADLLDMSASMEFEDGNFRRMTEAINNTDNSMLSGNFSASMRLDKFLPSDLGISIPAGVNLTGSITRPQVKNNTDVFLTDKKGMADNFSDIISDVYRKHNEPSDTTDMTAAEHYEKRISNVSAFVNYSKSAESKNPLVNLTADRISAEFRYSQSNSSNYQGPSFIDSIGDYVIRDSSNTYNGSLRYDLTPRNKPSWASGRPFEKIKTRWFPDGVKKYEFSLLPNKLSFDLAEVNYGSQFYRDNKLGVNTVTRKYDLSHSANFSYSPIAPLLDFDYSLNVKRDLNRFAGTDSVTTVAFMAHQDSIWNRNFILLGEKDRVQSASMRIDPNLFDWLPVTADYKTDYRAQLAAYGRDSLHDYLNTSITSSLNLNASLNIKTIVSNWAKATQKTAMKGFFAAVDSFFEKIALSSISFNYSATSNLYNNNIHSRYLEPGRLNFFQYQFGLNGKDLGSLFSGDMRDDAFGGMNSRGRYEDPDAFENDRRTVERTYSLFTSISLREPQISFNPIRLNWSKRYEVRAKKYPSYIDTAVVFPDLSLGMNTSSLMKLPMFSTAFQDFRVNSSFNYKKSYKNSSTLGFDTTRDFSMTPLVSVNGTIKKWPVTFSYSHNMSKTHTVDTTIHVAPDTLTNERLRRNTNSDEISVNYQFEKGKLKEIKLLRWTIPIKGQTSMGMRISRNTQSEIRDKDLTVTDQSGFTIAPFVTYTFTQNIDARLEYTYGVLDNKQTGDKTITNKGYLTISITFN